MADEALIAVHPEAVDDDLRALRWHVPAGTLAFVGAVQSAPGDLGQLVGDGTLESVTVHPAAVQTRLGPGRQWRTNGPRVRSALQAALGSPDLWVPGLDAGAGDEALRMAAAQVLAGEVGDYIRSHGGEISLLGVADGQVEVNLSGACSHCPASDRTLTQRVETAVRELSPGLRSLTATTDADAPAGARRLLALTPLRRR